MKLKIVSGGTPQTTKVMTEDGDLIEGITEVKFLMTPFGCNAEITVINFYLDVDMIVDSDLEETIIKLSHVGDLE